MSLSRTAVILLGCGAVGLAVVGVGAGATFTDSVHATQSVTAGTLNMTVTGPTDSTTNGKTVTFANFGPTGSTFTTGPQKVITKNDGDITAQALLLSASDTNNNAALQSGIYVEIDSYGGANGTAPLVVAYNGLLSDLEAHPISIQGPVLQGQTDPFFVTFYAGNNGPNTSGAGATNDSPSLLQTSQGGLVIPTITVDYTA